VLSTRSPRIGSTTTSMPLLCVVMMNLRRGLLLHQGLEGIGGRKNRALPEESKMEVPAVEPLRCGAKLEKSRKRVI